jgi:GntR family transcriptional regulator
MSINRDSAVPLYRQLFQSLHNQIHRGDYKTGEAIPTEEQLAAMYEVSRVTVRKALQGLVDEGLVVRQPGKGTFVAAGRFEEKQYFLRGFAELLADNPQQVMEVLSFEALPPSSHVAAQLELPEGKTVLRIKRRHLVRGEPAALAIIHLPYEIGRLLTTDEVRTTPIYELITRKTDRKIERATQRVTAVGATPDIAALLGVGVDAPLLLVSRVTYSTAGTALEYIQLYYPGSKHALVMDLYRDA